jgi:hypothetical protein
VPWHADSDPGCQRPGAYLYSRENEDEARQAKVLTDDEARRVTPTLPAPPATFSMMMGLAERRAHRLGDDARCEGPPAANGTMTLIGGVGVGLGGGHARGGGNGAVAAASRKNARRARVMIDNFLPTMASGARTAPMLTPTAED